MIVRLMTDRRIDDAGLDITTSLHRDLVDYTTQPSRGRCKGSGTL